MPETDDGMEEMEMTMATWSYEGETGPEAWGMLSIDFATCEAGMAQSPIALVTADADAADLPALTFNYGSATLTVEDTGYGFKATPDGAHTLTIGEDTYNLVQFHPHTPSEYTLDGESFPVGLHFVHQNAAGELAVVGVFAGSGDENAAYQPFVAAAGAGETTAMVENLAALLPTEPAYFTFDGSLTTPPCTEGVRWIVMREPIALSEAQIATIRAAHGATNRPLQPLNGRVVRLSN